MREKESERERERLVYQDLWMILDEKAAQEIKIPRY